MPGIQAKKAMIQEVLMANLAMIIGNPLPADVNQDTIYDRESNFEVDSGDFEEEPDLPDSDSGSSPPTPPHAPPPEWVDTLIEPSDIPYVNYVNMEHIGVKNKDACRGFSAIELFSLFFTEYALKLIGEQTNLYQQKCQAKGLID